MQHLQDLVTVRSQGNNQGYSHLLDEKGRAQARLESEKASRAILSRRSSRPIEQSRATPCKTAPTTLEVVANPIQASNKRFRTQVAQPSATFSASSPSVSLRASVAAPLYYPSSPRSSSSSLSSSSSSSSVSSLNDSNFFDDEASCASSDSEASVTAFARRLQAEQRRASRMDTRQRQEVVMASIEALESDLAEKTKEIARLRREKLEAENRAFLAARSARAHRQKKLARPAWIDSEDEDSEASTNEKEGKQDHDIIEEKQQARDGDDADSWVLPTTMRKRWRQTRTVSTSSTISSGRSSERRERRLREYEEERRAREEEELAHTKVRFKARPIPVSTLMPKYEEIREQAEARSLARKLDRQARLQDEVKPFARLERATKALQSRQKEQNENRRKQEQARRHGADANNSKQSPRKDFERTTREHMSLKERQIEEDRHRRARCDRRAQQLLRDSRLPQRLELHERQRARASQNGTDEKPAAPLECTFQPQVNTRVPDFAASKERWIRTLAQAKQKHKPTQPSVDHWSMFSKDAEARKERRKARAEAKQAAAEAARVQEKQRMASLVRRVQSEAARRPTTVNMTKSQEMRLRSCAEAKAKAKVDQERQAKRRACLADRQRKRSSVIRAMVQDAEEQRRASTAYTSLQDAAVKARERAKQDRLAWRERRRELREKMSNPRPDRAALIEQHGERQRLQTRKQAALARVAATLHAADGGKSTSAALSQDEMDLVRETIVQEQI